MKYIFDFDDVLFYTNKKFIPYEYIVLEKFGISSNDIKEYYKKLKLGSIPFSMTKMLDHFAVPGEVYDEIMNRNKEYVNEELLTVIKKAGKENCFILTYGDADFQRDKIKTAGIESLFSEIIVVQGSKKEDIEKICAKYRDEKIIFIDDKTKSFEDIEYAKCPNLKTVLYVGQNATDIEKEFTS